MLPKPKSVFQDQTQFLKMKNAIVFLFLLLNLCVVNAQYVVELNTSMPPTFTCTVAKTGTWTDQELLTWIFPDGQYMKSEMTWNTMNSRWEGNEVQWTPCVRTSPSPNGDNIQCFIARKGGTGTPPPFPPPMQIATPRFFAGSYNDNNPPNQVGFEIPANRTWQVNKTWEFSPNDETYLLVTYSSLFDSDTCTSIPSDYIELSFKTSDLAFSNNNTLRFNNEVIDETNTISSGVERKNVRINVLYNTSYQKRVFLKVKPQVAVGQVINITAKGTFCGFTDSVVLRYTVEAEPHDPNKKTVDIDTIYDAHANSLRLTYTIQFHNDGDAPVKKVVVTDQLPSGLNPATFHLLEAPEMNGLKISNLTNFSDLYSSNPRKEIIFEGQDGLPGIAQTYPSSYAYDQTIYRFKFAIDSDPNYKRTIENDAAITFYNGNEALDAIVTAIAPVYIVDQTAPRPRASTECCCNWSPFWCRFFNIFRCEKKHRCNSKTPQT